MADKTGIQWTDATWNPVRGCSVLSAGCKNCYAMRQAHRMNHPGTIEGNGAAPRRQRKPGAYYGLTELRSGKPVWSGKIRLVPELLDQPLRWRRPRMIFVNSMSDLFHEGVPFEFIAAVFGVVAACPQHTFQVLTKRPDRAIEFFRWLVGEYDITGDIVYGSMSDAASEIGDGSEESRDHWFDHMCNTVARDHNGDPRWPLPNVWLGVSVEDQAAADARIPLLMRCPAAMRWISAEPLLAPVDFTSFERVDWVVVGGESGPGARRCDARWLRSVIKQCREADVPVFVKQLGSVWYDWEHARNVLVSHRKGGDPADWPDDLRVRQWPAGVRE